MAPYRDPAPRSDEGHREDEASGVLEERVVLLVIFAVGLVAAASAAFAGGGPIAGVLGAVMMGLPVWTHYCREKPH